MSAPPVEVVTALARVLGDDRTDDACQLLRVDSLAKLEMMASEIQAIGDAATASPLANDAEEGVAAELLNRGVIALKELDALRRSHTDPLNAEVKAINDLFRVVTDPCEALVGPLKRDRNTPGGNLERLILAYRAEKKARIARQEAEARRKQEEAARKEAEALAKAEAAKTAKAREKALAEADAASRAQTAAVIAAPLPMTRGVRTDSGTVSDRERYVLEGISDPDLIPPSYWSDPVVIEALKKVLQAAIDRGAREIPGCVIGLRESLTRRSGR